MRPREIVSLPFDHRVESLENKKYPILIEQVRPTTEQGSGSAIVAFLQHFPIASHHLPEHESPGARSWEEGLLCG